MQKFLSDGYLCTGSIQYQGVVIAFASKLIDSEAHYYYRVLDIGEYDETAPTDENHWSDMKEMSFPEDYRPVGMDLANISDQEPVNFSSPLFTAFSDQSYIYLFRRSDRGTLNFNRYILNMNDKLLYPAWETRYKRSGKTDYSFNKLDTFGSTDMDGEKFLEPVFDLIMVKPMKDTTVGVAITENQISGYQIMNIFSLNGNNQIEIFGFKRGINLLPDLSDKKFSKDGTLMPDQVVSFKDLLPANSPSVAIYYRQESILNGQDNSQKFKRSIRLMLAVPVTKNSQTNVAAVDFAVAGDGSLVNVPEKLTLPVITEPSAMPLLNIDSRSLTLNGCVLNYLNTTAPVSLFCSSDGDLYLHFRQDTRQPDGALAFSVYSTSVTRSIFSIPTDSTDVFVSAFARQSGTIMNDASIVIKPSTDNSLYELTMAPKNPSGGLAREKWSCIPAGVSDFSAVVNGEASSELFSPQVIMGSKLFYDYKKQWYILAGKLTENGKISGTIAMVQAMPKLSNPSLPLTWTIDKKQENCDFSLSLKLENILLTEKWSKVPLKGSGIIPVINGLSSQYDYTGSVSAQHPVCKVVSGSGYIWFVSLDENIVQNTAEVDIVSDKVSTVYLTSDINSRTENWPDMPRDPEEVSDIINGSSAAYDYSKVQRNYAPGGKASEIFRCFISGADKDLENQRIACSSKGVKGSALAVACLWGYGEINPPAILQDQGVDTALPGNSSLLFNLSLNTKISDISSVQVTSGPVNPVQSGTDCAWLPSDTRYSLNFMESAIGINAQENINIVDSMCLEAWVLPDIFVEPYNRIIHHASKDDSSKYALGLFRNGDDIGIYAAMRESAVQTCQYPVKQGEWNHIAFSYKTGYSLEFDGIAYIDCGKSETLNTGDSITIETWIKVPSETTDKLIILSKYAETPDQQSYQITIENKQVVFRFRTSAKKNADSGNKYQQFECKADIPYYNEYFYIGAWASFETVTETSGQITTIKTIVTRNLFINETGGTYQPETIANETLQINISSALFTIGGLKVNNPVPTAVKYNIAEVRLWSKVLSGNTLYENYTKRKIADDTENLVSWWKLNEGNGRNASDTKKINNGIISSSLLWRFSREGAMWNIYINGQPQEVIYLTAEQVGGYGDPDSPKTNLGALSYVHPITQCFIGHIDEVRIWNMAKTQEEILDSIYSSLSGKESGLEAYWRMDEGQGEKVIDSSGGKNDGTFINPPGPSINTMFTFKDRTKLSLGMFMEDMVVTGINISPVDGNFQFNVSTNQNPKLTPAWDNTALQLTIKIDSKDPQPLVNNTPFVLPDIAQLTIQIGVTAGGTPRPIDSLTYKNTNPQKPVWDKNNLSPVGIDAPWCLQVPNGFPQPGYNQTISACPFINEYGDVENDINGNLRGIMKRCYMYINQEGELCLQTSFKIGELDMQFIGQIQTKPTLIGFIEGAPPVPSENLPVTNPLTDAYVKTTTLDLTESSSEVYKYTGKFDTYTGLSIDAKIGLYFGGETKVGVGVQQEVFKADFKIGLHVKSTTTTGVTNGKVVAAETDEAQVCHIDLMGFPEIKKDYDNNSKPRYLNPDVGQRYIPNNMGYALVKSGTADLYALRMITTGAVVSYVIQPNKTIPRDWNIIMFPIDPSYVKNGTLDGMVGLVSDPDYPSAENGFRGSYFKPVEAYYLKQVIEQEKETIKTYFTQVSSDPAYQSTTLDGPKGSLLRDWTNKVSKRSLVNTYVWTAQGGLYKQEEQFSDMKQISYGSSYQMNLQIGAYGSMVLRGGGLGFDVEADVLYGLRWEGSVISTEDYKDAFSMSVANTLKSWLNKRKADGTYETFNCPGMVTAYRFMSYYLAPSSDNFSTFWGVVDQNWLNNSNDPNALALQEAAQNENSVWRVLHRVTYVSRVPPETKNVPQENTVPAVKKPVCINFNAWFISLVDRKVSPHRSPAEIDLAVDTVLDKDLVNLDPYWADFWEKAHDHPEGEEAMKLLDIRKTAKAYMNDYYLTI